MKWGLIIRVLVTVLVLACVMYPFFDSLHPAGVLPFDVEQVEGQETVTTVVPRKGIPLPAGLQSGDRIDFTAQSLMTRLLYYGGRVRVGNTYVFKLQRDGKPVTVSVTAVPDPGAEEPALGQMAYDVFLFVLLLALGLVTLWWGRDWSAWGVSLFANLSVVTAALNVPLPPLAAAGAEFVRDWAVQPLQLAGFYFAAWALVGASLSARARRCHHLVYLLTVLVYMVFEVVDIGTTLNWWFNPLGDLGAWIILPFVVWALMPVEVLALGYRHAGASKRSNLRWLLWSIALLLGTIVGSAVTRPLFSDVAETLLWIVRGALITLALAGLLYGLLVRRVIPLSFFVHRGLVYGLTLAIVVLVFAAVEVLLVQTTLGKGASFVLTVLVSMGVALMLDQIHGRTGSFIERLLFRRRHIAVTKLKDFARHSAFMEDRTRLLDEAVDLVFTHMQPAGVAIYERAGDGYRCIRQKGAAFAEHVQIDYRAFVSLRAGSRRADLDGMTSDLGAHGHAFPMAVRGVLQGALVCGGRAERYTVDELDLMATVAHEVGIAHHVLHSRDSEALLNGLADGSIGPNAALESARKLLRLDPPRQLPE